MMGSTPPKEIVRTAVSCGMTAIDWVTTHGNDPRELKKISQDAGLKIAAHTMVKYKFLRREPDYLDEFKYSLDDACELEAPILMIPPFARKDQKSLEDDRKAWTEYYAQVCPLAQEAGITLTLESTGLRDSPIVTADEVLEVIGQVPGLKLVFDIGNTATADDPIQAYRKLREHVVHIHLKDRKIYDREEPGSLLKRNGKYFRPAVIGEGDLGLKKFWEEVDSRGRKLYVNLETQDYSEARNHAKILRNASDFLWGW
ncbi:MAG: sugar phosphate isomerase/epimerase [Lentisphaeria bacterium]|nr:sugar phosphate isomerase/epimerase [Lentisphaeria bacterium]